MAGRNAAATQAALLLTLQIWESLINVKYMKEASQHDALPCRTCNSSRDCFNYFCLQCKTGGLCPKVFRGDHEHRNHPWLQVRHYTRQDSVLSEDLAHFISKEGLKHIHTVNQRKDKQRHCNLTSKGVDEASSSSSSTRARAAGQNLSCQGCMASISGSRNSTETFLVCSLQCLVNVARERSELDLLAMNDGAMEHMKPPLSFPEKLLKRPRMLETPTKAPVDEAPPSPQATGDFPMSEAHEDLSAESRLETLPLPLRIDDYPIFGTPAETSCGEALPFPPATEDFSTLEKPTETPKLETFELPSDFQDFDITPEWEEMWL